MKQTVSRLGYSFLRSGAYFNFCLFIVLYLLNIVQHLNIVDMKTVSKLKLTQLSKTELGKREQNQLLGGENCCICGCTSSSSVDSFNANIRGGVSGLVPSNGGPGFGGGSFG